MGSLSGDFQDFCSFSLIKRDEIAKDSEQVDAVDALFLLTSHSCQDT